MQGKYSFVLPKLQGLVILMDLKSVSRDAVDILSVQNFSQCTVLTID